MHRPIFQLSANIFSYIFREHYSTNTVLYSSNSVIVSADYEPLTPDGINPSINQNCKIHDVSAMVSAYKNVICFHGDYLLFMRDYYNKLTNRFCVTKSVFFPRRPESRPMPSGLGFRATMDLKGVNGMIRLRSITRAAASNDTVFQSRVNCEQRPTNDK